MLSIIFSLIADEVREIMASLGIKKFDDLIGRSDLLIKRDAIEHWKAKNIDLTKILWNPSTDSQAENFNSSSQDHNLRKSCRQKVDKRS